MWGRISDLEWPQPGVHTNPTTNTTAVRPTHYGRQLCMYGDVFPSTSDTISRVEPFSPLACYRLREPRMLHKATNGHSPSEAEQSVLSRTWNSLTTSVSWLPSQSLPFCMRTQRTWCVRGVCGVCEDTWRIQCTRVFLLFSSLNS